MAGERVRGVHRAQVGVGLVELVLGAVLGERLDLAVAVRAERVLARARRRSCARRCSRRGRPRGRRPRRDRAVRAVVARLRSPGRRRSRSAPARASRPGARSEAADRALGRARLEAVEVLLAGLEDLPARRASTVWSRFAAQRQRAALHDPAEVPVARHLEADLAVPAEARRAASRGRCRAGSGRPRRRPAGTCRPAANGSRCGARARGERRVDGHSAEDEGAGAEARVRHEVPPVLDPPVHSGRGLALPLPGAPRPALTRSARAGAARRRRRARTSR